MISSIHLKNFRSYADKSFSLSPTVTLISGPNGSGKTNILEALYVACRGSSFRGSDAQMLRFDEPWWRIDVNEDDTTRRVTYDSDKSTAKKQFIVNGVKRPRLPAQQKLPVVLFEPNDLRLLQGSPTRRRDFIDIFIAQLEPSYTTHTSRYERALRQRNNLLKAHHVTPDELFVWDVTLSEIGAYIIIKRFLYTALLNTELTSTYQSISHTKDVIQVNYTSFLESVDVQSTQQKFLAELHRMHKKDIVLGYTTIGPHRDDIHFTMNNSPAMAIASRGETRSIVLSLKLIELNQVILTSDKAPLLLLDDVFSELDKKRRDALIHLSNNIQTIITTTDADVVIKHLSGDQSLINTALN